MRHLVLCLLFLLMSCAGAFGDDNIFNNTSTIKQELKDVKNEASKFVSTPADTEDNGLIYTLVTVGATGVTFAFDNNIRDLVQGSRSKTLDKATNIGNIIGNPFVHIGVAGVLYGGGILAKSPEYKEEGQMLGEALFLSDVSTFVLGHAIGRGRPSATNSKGDFKPFQFKSNFDSLPSMHTSSAFATASILSATTDSTPAKILYYTAATFVGFSRIYSNKHWASDVVLGAAIGELSGIVVMKYHSSKSSMAILPAFTGKTAGLIAVGKW